MDNWLFWNVINPITEFIAGAIGVAVGVAIVGAIVFGIVSALATVYAGLATVSATTWIIILLALILFKK